MDATCGTVLMEGMKIGVEKIAMLGCIFVLLMPVLVAADPCKFDDDGSPMDCTLTTETIKCPNKREFVYGPRIEGHFCCCRCKNNDFAYGKDDIRCHPRKKPEDKNEATPTPAAKNVSSPSVANLNNETAVNDVPAATNKTIYSTTSLLSRLTTPKAPTVKIPSTPIPESKEPPSSHGTPETTTTTPAALSTSSIIAIICVSIALALIGVIIVVAVLKRRKKNKSSDASGDLPRDNTGMTSGADAADVDQPANPLLLSQDS